MPLRTKRLLQLLAATGALEVAFMLLVTWAALPRTKYAEGFSTAGFQAIQPGATEEEVIRRLGRPLVTYPGASAEQWCFESPVRQHEHPLGSLLGWPSADECLSLEKGVVVSVRTNGHGRLAPLLGKTVAEAERRLGRPKYILPLGPKTVMRYSDQQEASDSYEAHEVLLDGERIVRGTDSYVSVE